MSCRCQKFILYHFFIWMAQHCATINNYYSDFWLYFYHWNAGQGNSNPGTHAYTLGSLSKHFQNKAISIKFEAVIHWVWTMKWIISSLLLNILVCGLWNLSSLLKFSCLCSGESKILNQIKQLISHQTYPHFLCFPTWRHLLAKSFSSRKLFTLEKYIPG